MTRQTTGNGAVATRPSETIGRWDAWTEFENMRHQMEELFGRYFGYTPLNRLIPSGPGASSEFELSPDIFETNDALVFVFAVPGIEPGALHVSATGNALTITGERTAWYTNENARQIRQGCCWGGLGAFNWSYNLPVEVNPGKIQANYRNGILEIHLPKLETTKAKTVKVAIRQN